MSQVSRVSITVALTAVSHVAAAQVGLSPSGIDVGVGFGYGAGGGPRVTRGGGGASAVVAWRVRSVAPGALLLGIAASAQAVLDFKTTCVLLAPGTPGGRCTPNYPRMQSIGVAGGWEARRGVGAAVRVLAGPGAFHSGEGATAVGLQGRVDVATPSDGRVAFLAWGQGALVPRLRRESYRIASGGLGLRVR